MSNIIFTADSIRAILDGRKTQTRRVIKPQPELITARGSWLYDGWVFVGDDAMQSHLFHDVYGNGGSPYGSVYGDGTADRLWVRETFAYKSITKRQIFYRADFGNRTPWDDSDMVGAWRPSIHMPRWASRITLEVTDIRVERLQDITEADAMAEGVDAVSLADVPRQATMNRRADFKQLWDYINAKRGYSWDNNPWVWVIEFKRVQ